MSELYQTRGLYQRAGRIHVWLCACLLLLMRSTWGQVPTVAPNDRAVVHLVMDHPCTVTVQRCPAPHETTAPVAWALEPVTHCDIHINLEGSYFVQGHGDGFLVRYELPPEPVNLLRGTTVYLHPQFVLVAVHAAWVGGLACLVVCAGLFMVVRWLHDQRPLARTPSVPRAERLNLFPADGSLPAVIPPYRIVGKLGSGGMAVVYKAENEQGEQFALKIPFPNLLHDTKFMQRFTREAKIGARLRHPNLVSLLAVNDDSNPDCPYPYLVMELVDGTTLDGLLRNCGTLPVDEAIPIVLDILAGLQVVHAHRIVHRDIKPGNIMLAKGRARLMDFGIAHKDETRGGKLTGSWEVIGTPRYMAPEMVDSKPVDARCDIYSVGFLLYQMLSDTDPYGTDDMYVLLAMKTHLVLPPLASVCTVPVQLGALVDRMVSLDREDRPADVQEVMKALQAFKDGP